MAAGETTWTSAVMNGVLAPAQLRALAVDKSAGPLGALNQV